MMHRPQFVQPLAAFCNVHVPQKVITMMKKLLLMLVALSFASPVLLTGCNTVQGAGKDVESAGKAVKDEAAEHKKY